MQEYEVAIIGGGPAGLTAGLYASRYGLNTVLIERGMYGGQIVNAGHVENYPGFPKGVSGMDLGQMFYDQAIRFGLQTQTSEVTAFKQVDKLFQITTYDGEVTARAVIIASGSEYRKLGVPGEDKLTGRGVSYCATCDGFLFKGKDVAVIGGGDTAVSDAMELSQHCSKVYVVHRRHELRATQALQRVAMSIPKIQFVWDSVIWNVEGEDKVSGLTVKSTKTGDLSKLAVEGVFVAIGFIPNNSLFKGLVDTDETGSIVTDDLMRTKLPGLFAVGDIRRNSARQVATAVGDGAAAGKAVFAYIKEG
jgi:thioredoxin reductase (NADPH)